MKTKKYSTITMSGEEVRSKIANLFDDHVPDNINVNNKKGQFVSKSVFKDDNEKRVIKRTIDAKKTLKDIAPDKGDDNVSLTKVTRFSSTSSFNNPLGNKTYQFKYTHGNIFYRLKEKFECLKGDRDYEELSIIIVAMLLMSIISAVISIIPLFYGVPVFLLCSIAVFALTSILTIFLLNRYVCVDL